MIQNFGVQWKTKPQMMMQVLPVEMTDLYQTVHFVIWKTAWEMEPQI